MYCMHLIKRIELWSWLITITPYIWGMIRLITWLTPFNVKIIIWESTYAQNYIIQITITHSRSLFQMEIQYQLSTMECFHAYKYVKPPSTRLKIVSKLPWLQNSIGILMEKEKVSPRLKLTILILNQFYNHLKAHILYQPIYHAWVWGPLFWILLFWISPTT